MAPKPHLGVVPQVCECYHLARMAQLRPASVSSRAVTATTLLYFKERFLLLPVLITHSCHARRGRRMHAWRGNVVSRRTKFSLILQ